MGCREGDTWEGAGGEAGDAMMVAQTLGSGAQEQALRAPR